MKLFKTNLFLALCFFYLNANADCFKGTIGNYPIIIDFPTKDIGNFFDNGGYFYESKLQKIIFSKAEGSKEHILLKTYNSPLEEFDLILKTDGSYQGTWKDFTSKKTLPVKLKPFDFKTIKNPFLGKWDDAKILDPLWYIASSRIKFKRDTTETLGKIKIDWYSDNIYKIKFFRIHSPNNPRLYRHLEDWHLENIEGLFRGCNCDGNDEKFRNSTFPVNEVGNGIISYNFSEGVCYCYSAAHPSLSEKSENLDILKDEVLDFDKVFQFSNKELVYSESNWPKWGKYRETFVAPEIVKILKQSNPSLLESPEDEEDKKETECYYLENSLWKYLENWQLIKDEIILKHYERARGYGPCMETFHIPKKYFLKYITPQYRNRIFQNK